MGERLTYVIDTNILIDYVDIVPSPGCPGASPKGATIDLCDSNLVIPTAVIRELSSFKREKSDRGKAARVALKRIREITEGKLRTIRDSYNLSALVYISPDGRRISILPVHKEFKKALPFSPADTDMDGQIILATLATEFIRTGLPIDGTADRDKVANLSTENVILLTNDNGLAIRARERGIKTQRYGYQYPKPYTGRRDIVVPKVIFYNFYNDGVVEREFFEAMMPEEEKLVANEFIVMKLENQEDYPFEFDPDDDPFFLHIGRYDVEEDAIVRLRYVSTYPTRICNDGQAMYAEALANPSFPAVICTGPAGSGKTYMATIYGYHACKNGEYIGVTVVPCETRDEIGALPGDLDEKMDPDVQPLKNALRNYLLSEDPKFRKELEVVKKYGTENAKSKRRNGNSSPLEEEAPDRRSLKARLEDRVELIWKNWFSSIPIGKARGRDFSYELAIYDEFQDQNTTQADTLIKRIGKDGKIIITGDVHQIHAPYLDSFNNGIVYATQQLFNNPMVVKVHFMDDEVMRHPLVKAIAKHQKNEEQKEKVQ